MTFTYSDQWLSYLSFIQVRNDSAQQFRSLSKTVQTRKWLPLAVFASHQRQIINPLIKTKF